jgi:beta-galactosidase
MKRFITLGLVVLGSVSLFAAELPRERLLLDRHWRFHLGDAPDAGNIFDYPEPKDLSKTLVEEVGLAEKLTAKLPDPVATNLGHAVSFVENGTDDTAWRQLDLPHDWAVELPFNNKANLQHGFKDLTAASGTTIGWYRRGFALPASDKSKSLWIEFDGVYRNAVVWLNGHCLGRFVSGYDSFRCDIGQYANFGDENVLVVRVAATRFEGWFYEGAGIYRHVWLVKTNPLHIPPEGVFVYTKFANNVPEGAAEVHVETTLAAAPIGATAAKVRHEILSPAGKSVATTEQAVMLDAKPGTVAQTALNLPSPALWSPETPTLYKLVTTIESGGKVVDRVETQFGVRTVAFDATKGFLLNGQPYIIKGTCNHQDHAGVGAALPDALQYYRVQKLKELGSNAYRTTHNPPTPELLEACDRLGMLVMDEVRRMDTSPQTLDDLKALIVRDRNHPSIFIWSLGNEEFYLQGTKGPKEGVPAAYEAAIKIATVMQDLAHQLDPTRLCTVAMNGGWGDGFSKVVDVQGFNYRTKNIEAFHAKFPQQPTIGTETASTRTTRGIYADDKERGYVAAYGENGVEKAWDWWPYFATHPFTSGGFIWTGFDYRGEPTPYKWPCINSHFGLMDTCGFPKDLYYYYQASWTDKPVLHLAPHWNWAGHEGTPVLVRCFTNCKEVELFLNGKSLGRQTMVPNRYLDWKVPYEAGVLSAKGFDGDKVVTETKVETTGAPAAIQLSPDRATIHADGQDLSIVNVAVTDAQGRVVPTADVLLKFEVRGAGKIIGVGNGDPSSHEPDRATERKAFNGFAQVLVQADEKSGAIQLTATSVGLHVSTVTIKADAAPPPAAVP